MLITLGIFQILMQRVLLEPVGLFFHLGFITGKKAGSAIRSYKSVYCSYLVRLFFHLVFITYEDARTMFRSYTDVCHLSLSDYQFLLSGFVTCKEARVVILSYNNVFHSNLSNYYVIHHLRESPCSDPMLHPLFSLEPIWFSPFSFRFHRLWGSLCGDLIIQGRLTLEPIWCSPFSFRFHHLWGSSCGDSILQRRVSLEPVWRRHRVCDAQLLQRTPRRLRDARPNALSR